MTYLDLLQQKVEALKISNKNNDLAHIVDVLRYTAKKHI